MMVMYRFSVRVNGAYKPGLNLQWRTFTKYDGSVDMMRYAPPIKDIGNGYYLTAWSTALGGECAGDVFDPLGTVFDDPIELQFVNETPNMLRLSPSVMVPDTTTAIM